MLAGHASSAGARAVLNYWTHVLVQCTFVGSCKMHLLGLLKITLCWRVPPLQNHVAWDILQMSTKMGPVSALHGFRIFVLFRLLVSNVPTPRRLQGFNMPEGCKSLVRIWPLFDPKSILRRYLDPLG